jgi:hypothetical protein
MGTVQSQLAHIGRMVVALLVVLSISLLARQVVPAATQMAKAGQPNPFQPTNVRAVVSSGQVVVNWDVGGAGTQRFFFVERFGGPAPVDYVADAQGHVQVMTVKDGRDAASSGFVFTSLTDTDVQPQSHFGYMIWTFAPDTKQFWGLEQRYTPDLRRGHGTISIPRIRPSRNWEGRLAISLMGCICGGAEATRVPIGSRSTAPLNARRRRALTRPAGPTLSPGTWRPGRPRTRVPTIWITGTQWT